MKNTSVKGATSNFGGAEQTLLQNNGFEVAAGAPYHINSIKIEDTVFGKAFINKSNQGDFISFAVLDGNFVCDFLTTNLH
ncbi:hypothetical protein [uncultured Cyclobacterium sp.]|uniref:hypothetical protein n=1 Tax=uncultured Cyclobacterium sp. TaxID=453820 RepID=UPI0030ED2C72|tara:strand:+ start:7115 stop:7354 length:240 start_codon:yes stop_codon:yes gene_type:complete